MCSIPEDETEILVMEDESCLYSIESENCKKCSTNKAGVLLRKKDAYCNTCFVENVTHKFRASLGKTKLVRHGNKVLIAFSGDGSSCALLDLLKTGSKEETHKKLKFDAIAVYVDEGAILNESDDERRQKMDRIYKLIQENSFPIKLFFTSFSNAFKRHPELYENIADFKFDEESETQAKKLISSLKNLTTKKDLCQRLRQSLLLSCAKMLDCQFVFLAETATKLAAKLLCDVSLGGGSHLSSDVNFCDARSHIKVLRPLKDFSTDELKHFISLNNIIFIEDSADSNPYTSIQSLTNKFVQDLQENFPATITTVLRTGEKLENKYVETPSEDETCVLCLSILDTQSNPCSSLEATEYSKFISNTQSQQNIPIENEEIPKEDCENIKKCGDCHCQRKGAVVNREDIERFTCYSCRLILKDIKDVNHLPMNILSAVELRKCTIVARNEISEFLL